MADVRSDPPLVLPPRRLGRPPAAHPCSSPVTVRLTAREYAALLRAAHRADVSVSALIRDVVTCRLPADRA